MESPDGGFLRIVSRTRPVVGPYPHAQCITVRGSLSPGSVARRRQALIILLLEGEYLAFLPPHGERVRTYTVKLNEYQLRVLLCALDLYSRMGMGQLEVAVTEFLNYHFWQNYADTALDGLQDGLESAYAPRAVESLVFKIKRIVFGHGPYSSWGVRSPRVPLQCREAYDIHQVLQKTRAQTWLDDPNESDIAKRHIHQTVGMNAYWAVNPEQPPVQCYYVEEEE